MTRRALGAASIALLIAASAPAEEHEVSVVNFAFVPAELEIQVGDTVTWTNEGGVHNVNAPGFFRCANGCDGEGGNGNPASNPWVVSRTFNSEAEIAYQCDAHVALGMVGSLTVVPAGPSINVVGGSCPGTVTISGTGFTANREIALVGAGTLNGFTKGGALCNGTTFEIGEPFNLPPRFVFTDANGSFTAAVQTVAGRCFLEGLDLNGTCETSNAVDTSAPE